MKTRLIILNSSGDLKITWDHDNPMECDEARKQVAELKALGYTFYQVDGNPADEVSSGKGMLIVRRLTADEVLSSTLRPVMPELSGATPEVSGATPEVSGATPEVSDSPSHSTPFMGGELRADEVESTGEPASSEPSQEPTQSLPPLPVEPRRRGRPKGVKSATPVVGDSGQVAEVVAVRPVRGG